MMKCGLIQFAPRLGDEMRNISAIDALLQDVPQGALIVLPELANSGYRFTHFDEAWQYAATIDESDYVHFLIQRCQEKNIAVVTGFLEKEDSSLYNSSLLIDSSGVLSHYRKIHLFCDEKDIFTPGNLGVPVVEVEGVKVAMLICFDWMFPEVWRMAGLAGADVVCHPANLVLPYAQSVVPSYALLNRFYVITANRYGTERDLSFSGQSVMVAPNGEVLYRAPQHGNALLLMEVDTTLSRNKMITPKNHLIHDRRPQCYHSLLDNTK